MQAYGFLNECVKTIEYFDRESCTFKQAMVTITGLKRISEKDINLFKRFYEETYTLSFLAPQHERNQQVHDDLERWERTDSMPLKTSLDLVRPFRKWRRKLRSEIESIKGAAGAKAKKKRATQQKKS
jgi:hypothetical protein